jgi:hypothetical protein
MSRDFEGWDNDPRGDSDGLGRLAASPDFTRSASRVPSEVNEAWRHFFESQRARTKRRNRIVIAVTLALLSIAAFAVYFF